MTPAAAPGNHRVFPSAAIVVAVAADSTTRNLDFADEPPGADISAVVSAAAPPSATSLNTPPPPTARPAA